MQNPPDEPVSMSLASEAAPVKESIQELAKTRYLQRSSSCEVHKSESFLL